MIPALERGGPERIITIKVSVLKNKFPRDFRDFYGQDPDGEIENIGKSIFEIRIPNFCYIQVIVFDLRQVPFQKVGKQHYGDSEIGIKSFDFEPSKMELILAIYQMQRLGLSKSATMKKM